MEDQTATVRAGVAGLLIGALTFIMIAGLWRIGDSHLARTAAESMLLVALLGVAIVSTLGRPAQMRRARVPIKRAVPPEWWPPESDGVPLLALCLGGPVVIAGAFGALLFR